MSIAILELFSYDCCYNPSCTSIITELTEIDALPCAEIQTSVGYRNADANTAERALGMSRHVIRTFKNVVVVWLVLLDETIEYLFHVTAHVRICVFVYAQSTTGMLHKEVKKTCLRQGREVAKYFSCYEMETSALC